MTKQEEEALYAEVDGFKAQLKALTKRVEELEAGDAEAKARSETPGWWKAPGPDVEEAQPLPPGQGKR